MKKNKIQLIGEINYEMFEKFCVELHEMECALKDNQWVNVELCSDGGSAEVALAFRGRIRASGLDIRITGYGYVASAAVLVLAAGDHRCLASEAWVMLHEEQAEIEGSVSEIEALGKQLRRTEIQWAELLEQDSSTESAMWLKLHKDTTHLTAEQALFLGLIEEIV